jgi:hypothetical protein
MLTTLAAADIERTHAETVVPDSFDPPKHYYPRALNAQVHPLVSFFLRLKLPQIVSRYCHLNPQVDSGALTDCLVTQTRCMQWAGADLFYTVTEGGVRRMTVIETNSCPSGNKSMPLLNEGEEQGGYRRVLEHAFLPSLRSQKRRIPNGGLAVLYDKNFTEASGYAGSLADLTNEPVYLAPLADGAWEHLARFDQGVLHVLDDGGVWQPIRGAFRYVTQRPWNRIPVNTKTLVFNPVMACLAGGRNKLLASTAYELSNAHLAGSGLAVRTPETVRDVGLREIPLWVKRFGGYAVVKNPYGNAGQGVWTITNRGELDTLMAADHRYERFVVQALIGNASWSSSHAGSRYHHVGTVPTSQGQIFVADLRVMVANGPDGFVPVALYGRRAREPLCDKLEPGTDSWSMLGTNLSAKRKDGGWDADTDRLLLMDRRDFNRLGIGLDDLIEAYIQTVLSVLAIDRMATTLTTRTGNLKRKLFRSLDDDEALMSEIL